MGGARGTAGLQLGAGTVARAGTGELFGVERLAHFLRFRVRAAAARVPRAHQGASHEPSALPRGLLGAEPPSAWGGWDYSALAHSVDWIEEHHSVVGREMFRSFAPAARCLSSFSTGQEDDLRRLWDRWLRGDAGCILQQHQRWLAPPDYQPAPDAKAFLAELRCLTGGLTLLRNAAAAGKRCRRAVLFAPFSPVALDVGQRGRGFLVAQP